MSALTERQHAENPGNGAALARFHLPVLLHRRQRNGILARHGLHVIDFAFQAHSEVHELCLLCMEDWEPTNEDLRKVIAAGVNIVDIDSRAPVAWRHGLANALIKPPNEVAPYKIVPFVEESVKQIVARA